MKSNHPNAENDKFRTLKRGQRDFDRRIIQTIKNKAPHITNEDISQTKSIGSGAFGKVYKHGNLTIKFVPPHEMNNELSLIYTMNQYLSDRPELQKYIMSYGFATAGKDKTLGITSELQENGSLTDLMVKLKMNKPVDPRLKEAFAHDPANVAMVFSKRMHDCMEAMHELNILWRDAAPRNFLVGSFQDADFKRDPSGKIIGLNDAPIRAADFGLSQTILNKNKSNRTTEDKIPISSLDNNACGVNKGKNIFVNEATVMTDRFAFRTAIIALMGLLVGKSNDFELLSRDVGLDNVARLKKNYEAALEESRSVIEDIKQDHDGVLSNLSTYEQSKLRCAEAAIGMLGKFEKFLTSFPTGNTPNEALQADLAEWKKIEMALAVAYSYQPSGSASKTQATPAVNDSTYKQLMAIDGLRAILNEYSSTSETPLDKWVKTTKDQLNAINKLPLSDQLKALEAMQDKYLAAASSRALSNEVQSFHGVVDQVLKNTPHINIHAFVLESPAPQSHYRVAVEPNSQQNNATPKPTETEPSSQEISQSHYKPAVNPPEETESSNNIKRRAP